MNLEQDFLRLVKQEFKDINDTLIWKDENGDFHVFGHYKIVPEKPKYHVFCGATEVGPFNSTRAALSWCIADKHKLFSLARDILTQDTKLGLLTQDIQTRAGAADKSTKVEFREIIGTKLESKIIRKKQIEQALNKSINFAKYYEQRGFANETARTSRNPNNKTSRKGI